MHRIGVNSKGCAVILPALGYQKKRLAITTHGKVRYKLKTPFRDGTTGDRRSHVIFEPLYFIARLAPLVPKSRVNLTRFHGVFVRGGFRGVATTKQSTPRENNTG